MSYGIFKSLHFDHTDAERDKGNRRTLLTLEMVLLGATSADPLKVGAHTPGSLSRVSGTESR